MSASFPKVPTDVGRPAGAWPSFERLFEAVEAAPIKPSLKTRHHSDLQTLVRMSGRPAAQLSTEPAALRALLADIEPQLRRLSDRRRANLRYSLRRALWWAGLLPMPGRCTNPLSPAWEALLARINPDLRLRRTLERPMRLFSLVGVEPQSVGRAELEWLRRTIFEDPFIRDPRIDHRRLWLALVWCQENVPDWPLPKVEAPRYRNDGYVLGWADLPASLKSEAEKFTAWYGGWELRAAGASSGADDAWGRSTLRSFITRGARRRPASRATCERRFWEIQRCASILRRLGLPCGSLEELTRPAAVDAIMGFLSDRANKGVTKQMFDLACFLKMVARRWVKRSEADLADLKSICDNVEPREAGMTKRNMERLVALMDEAKATELELLPFRLAARVRRAGARHRNAAARMQIAVALAILRVAPLRISNLCALRLERNLRFVTYEGRRRAQIFVPKEMVKNRRDLLHLLDEEATELVETYLREHRPTLQAALGDHSDHVFPGEGARHKGRHALGLQISRTIKRYTGLDIHPHLFRHYVVLDYLLAHPGEYETLRHVLSHATTETIRKHYAGLEARAAAQRFEEHVLARRRALREAERQRGGRSRRAQVHAAGASRRSRASRMSAL